MSERASIIVVNYNGRRFLDDCLSALRLQTYPETLREVILVDNGSSDGSVEQVRRQFPWVRLIASKKNLGFAGGNNLGIKAATGRYIALLNNDTRVEPAWLETLVHGLDADPALGAMASKILLKDQPAVIQSAGLCLYRDGRGGDRGFRQVDRGQFDDPTEVFGACGASVLFRREMLEDVGLLDERFFVYYEDLDLAWRARLRGWKFAYEPRSVVYHVHCATSGEWSPFFLFHVERNRVFVSVKNAPARVAIRSLAVFAARALRKWYRVATLRERRPLDWGQAQAYLPAALSLAVYLPEMLCKRVGIRWLHRKVADAALAHLILPKP